MAKKYYMNNKKRVTGRRRFKCLDCGQRFGTYQQLFLHATKYHKDLIEDMDPDRYLYEKRNPGPHICTICKTNPTEWDPRKKKYNRICNNEECHRKSREMFSKNMKRIYGTDNLLNDPERQAAMLANRSISGTFKWPDGVTINYVGRFELDFLEQCVKRGFGSEDIIPPPPTYYVQYFDDFTRKMRYYIPDFFMPKYNLIIEIKDASKYPIDSKAKMRMKESAVIKLDKFNFIKIVEKDYSDFDDLLKNLAENNVSEYKDKSEHIFIIPESSAV